MPYAALPPVVGPMPPSLIGVAEPSAVAALLAVVLSAAEEASVPVEPQAARLKAMAAASDALISFFMMISLLIDVGAFAAPRRRPGIPRCGPHMPGAAI